jgi:hypothetical protein
MANYMTRSGHSLQSGKKLAMVLKDLFMFCYDSK